MSLLILENVSRRYRQGAGERVVLRDVSLTLNAGELVAIRGPRQCGRSTLLRVASGIEPPDSGIVRFAGRDLTRGGGKALGNGIGFCRRLGRECEARRVLDELLLAQLAFGVTQTLARTKALRALGEVSAEDCATRRIDELDGSERVRVAIARALVLEPSLLVIDDPISGVDLLERDAVLALMRSLADSGIAVLISATDALSLAGADRALSLAGGELRGSVAPELAEVVPLRRQASA